MGLKRNYVGIELSPDYCEMTEKRIAKNKIQSELLNFKIPNLFENQA
jgi:DNA modification methylase